MMLKNVTISSIRSGKGDCIHLNYNGYNLIVDSGPSSSAGEFRKLCESIQQTEQSLDTLIISHYDDDHIGGILKNSNLSFHDVYFNAFEGTVEDNNFSAKQNQRLFRMLPRTIAHPSVFAGDEIEAGGAKLTIHGPITSALSMAKEQMAEADAQLGTISDWSFTFDELIERDYPSSDVSVSNQASIVFTFEYGDCRILFTGDAWAKSFQEDILILLSCHIMVLQGTYLMI